MAEPFIVHQTFELKHAANDQAANAWFKQQSEEAQTQGGTFSRYSFTETDQGRGLLFECWLKQPEDQGNLRWSFAAGAV